MHDYYTLLDMFSNADFDSKSVAVHADTAEVDDNTLTLYILGQSCGATLALWRSWGATGDAGIDGTIPKM